MERQVDQTVSASWDEWKSQLADAVRLGQSMNMSPEQLAERAARVGDFLANKVDPKNPQQKVLQELWQAADDQEQQAMASAIIKLVSGARVH